MSRALVIIAEGNEEMEATITIDLLRRAGVDVAVAGLDGAVPVKMSRGVVIEPDLALSDVEGDFDVLVLPGGRGGAEAFCKSEVIARLLKDRERAGQRVAAICAAPMALAAHRVFGGKRMTSHPSVTEQVSAHGQRVDEPVVVDGPLITSQGPGTAFHFGLALIEALEGAEKAAEVKGPLMLPA